MGKNVGLETEIGGFFGYRKVGKLFILVLIIGCLCLALFEDWMEPLG